MSESKGQVGFAFTALQKAMLADAAGRIGAATGVSVEPYVAQEDGAELFMLNVNDEALGVNRVLVSVEAIGNGSNPVRFAARDFDHRQVGPELDYEYFAEAVSHAESFATGTLSAAKRRRAGQAEGGQRLEEAAATATGVYVSGSPLARETFHSAILTPHEVRLVRSFADGIGHAANGRGFAKFVESPAGIKLTSIALGFIDGTDTPRMLGTVVASANPDGSRECSARTFDNTPIPGPEYYPDLASALLSAQPYYEQMATQLGKQFRRSWLGKVRDALLK